MKEKEIIGEYLSLLLDDIRVDLTVIEYGRDYVNRRHPKLISAEKDTLERAFNSKFKDNIAQLSENETKVKYLALALQGLREDIKYLALALQNFREDMKYLKLVAAVRPIIRRHLYDYLKKHNISKERALDESSEILKALFEIPDIREISLDDSYIEQKIRETLSHDLYD
jgi:hypothetical protein